MFPAHVEGEDVFCLRDPTGLAPKVAVLPRAAAFAAALCDGSRSVEDVIDELKRRVGVEVGIPEVQGLLDQLDEGLFLDSERFAAHQVALREEFRATSVRACALAGASYPDDPAELARYLGAQAKAQVTPRSTEVLIAPHIDFHRGGSLYSLAYGALPAEPPELVIVFGTDHNGTRHPFTLTRKRYDTPFGAVETDVDLVDHLAGHAGGERLFADEFHHKNEHSLEFQAVWLRHTFGERTPPMLPILCGSLHRHVAARTSPRSELDVAGFLTTLAAAVAGKRVLVIAAADLAHVGPRFGDRPMTAEDRKIIETADSVALAAAGRGDAEGFFAAVAAEKDRFRVCGLAPIYHAFALAGKTDRKGELLAYAQCSADEKDASFVSIAALAA